MSAEDESMNVESATYEQHDLAKYKFVETAPGKWSIGDMPVDPSQGFKAKEIQLFSFARPHMRAFHFSWLSFFSAFICWFAFAPLMPVVRRPCIHYRTRVYKSISMVELET